jgi:leukotriene-A4 hydrolase
MPDPTSQSNYLQIATEDVYFDWNVDFQQKVISGFAVHTLIVKQDGVREVV